MIEIRIILEVIGAPKEHIEKVMNDVVEKIKKEEDIKVLKSEIKPIQEVDTEKFKEYKGFFTTFAELDLAVETTDRVMDICFDYMPSTLEILKPDSLEVDSQNFAALLNDLLERLHRFDLVIKNLTAENMIMKKKLEDNQNTSK